MQTPIGSTVGSYLIQSQIGRGGMGVVYQAQHVRLRTRQVALKVLAPELTADESFRQRFIDESELAASLEHPNIIPVYDAGESDGVLYIAMRLVRGTDLAKVLAQEKRLDPNRALRVLWPVAAALDYAHGRGLVHRDVKPANTLLERTEGPDAREHVFLSDFGLGKQIGSTSHLTMAGQFVGTLSYAAPEQFRGERPSPATDVYALGCMLVECLSGQVPFPHDSEPAVMYAHLSEPAPRISQRVPGAPPEFDAVVSRALAKSPEDRFQGCREMMQAAHAALTGATGAVGAALTGPGPAPMPRGGAPDAPLGVGAGSFPGAGSAPPPGAVTQASDPGVATAAGSHPGLQGAPSMPAPPPAAPPPFHPSHPAQQPAGRRTAVWVLAGAIAAIVALVAGFLVLQGGSDTPTVAPTTVGPTGGPTTTGPTATGPTATGPTATAPTATGPTATGPPVATCGPVQTIPPFPGAANLDTVHLTTPPALTEYSSQPPVSGPHSDLTLPEGVYRDPPAILPAVHSLEHAAVIIWIAPSLPAEQGDQLLDEFTGLDHLVLAEYDYPEPGGQLPEGTLVALTAWHRLQLCSGVNLEDARQFVRDFVFDPDAVGRYRGDAPELGIPI